ncbi:MAG TPA: 50S ribosomal protein L29 [Myxococcota bacterium]|nr:50S ribosomal protein L29 [Myxococcota bacterium]
MKTKDLRELSVEELEAKGRELRSELFSARIKKVTGQLENTAKVRNLRRDVARVETVLHARREAAEGAEK